MGLPVVAPTVIVPSTGIDPGVTGNGDQLEATIDVTRAGSVAPGATIDLVVSGTPSGSMLNGLAIAVEYAVDNDTAPILSISFYECEQNGGSTWTDFYDTLFQQAAAEGMSVFVCAGDSGAAGCDTDDETPPATQFLNPNYICASGSATCVGGTEFADVASPSTYWNATNSTGMGSAKGYVPEGAWNEPLNASNEPTIWAGGGGVSTIITKPAWQAGTGVPADGFRDTPDIAFSSSAHDGYFACYASGQGNCAINEFEYVFGTSAAAPSMAGILAIADQKAGMAQGNVNQLLYTLAAGPAAAQVFHDVTVATSGVASCTGLPSMCNNSTPGTAGLSGGLVGYTVGAGFDLATGWGSLDVAHFIETFGCVGAADGTSCSDGNECTLTDTCHGGLCTGTPVVCTALDACHAVGTCSPVTGQCDNPVEPDGTSCSSGDLCSPGACEVGVCTGTPVVCMPMDSCHTAGTCSMTTGQCSNPAKPDGSSCSGGGTCASGVCVPPPSGGDAGPDAGNGDAGGGSRDSGSAADSGNSGSASDGGSGPGPGQPSGCGCKVAGQSEERASPLGGAMVALVVLALGRRRGTRSTRAAPDVTLAEWCRGRS
jgi:hypothetical protein